MSGEFSSDAPLLDELALNIIESTKGQIRTSIPAEVLDYNADKQTITAQVTIRSRYIDKDTEESISYLPKPISNVPVAFPMANGFSFTWPLFPGDKVMLLIADRSISEWKSTAQQDNEPIDKRRFDLSDAIALPGLVSPANPGSYAKTDQVYIKSERPFIIDCRDIRLSGPNPTDFVALANKVMSELDIMRGIFNGHIHTITLGPPTATVPTTLMPDGGSVASAYVRTD